MTVLVLFVTAAAEAVADRVYVIVLPLLIVKIGIPVTRSCIVVVIATLPNEVAPVGAAKLIANVTPLGMDELILPVILRMVVSVLTL